MSSEGPGVAVVERGADRLTYLPGLDGLRGVAVAAVFLFHGGVSWMSGSFLAVSTFFTLSGFLITALLLREQASLGTVRLGRFWERRIRRLLPAAALGVALAALVTLAVGDPAQTRALGGDGLATLLDVANWRFVAAGRSYSSLFSTPGALQHAWSLAIEAQFYWIYPLAALGLLRVLRGNRLRFGLVLAVLAAASVGLTRYAGFGHDRIYYGTDTRAAELLAGALLAVAVSGRAGGFDAAWSARARRGAGIVGGAGALVVAACWVATPRTAAWVDQGGLAVYAVASAALVLGAAVSGTVVARVLSLRPLRALGRVSYGAYLFHWPILVWLAPDRVVLAEPLRLGLAAALTLALAAASYRWVEMPIRTHRGALGQRSLRWAVTAAALVAIVPTLAVSRSAPEASAAEADQASGTLISDIDKLVPAGSDAPVVPAEAPASPGTTATAPPVGPPSSTTVPPGPPIPAPIVRPSRPLRVLVVGDSTAVYLDPLLDEWGHAQGVWSAANHARIGCGIARGGPGRTAFGDAPLDAACDDWPTEWPGVLARTRPDLIVLASSFWEATDRQLPGDPTWRRPGDPSWDAFVAKEYGVALDILSTSGVPIAWLDHPPISFRERSDFQLVNPQLFDASRMARLDQIQDQVAAGRPLVRVVRTNRFFGTWPGGVFDRALRPDGLHVDGAGARPLIAWLGPELLDTYWAVPPGR